MSTIIYRNGIRIPAIEACIAAGHEILSVHKKHPACAYETEARNLSSDTVGKAHCSRRDTLHCSQCDPTAVEIAVPRNFLAAAL